MSVFTHFSRSKHPRLGAFFIMSVLSVGLFSCSDNASKVQKQSYHQAAEITSIEPQNQYTVLREYMGKVVAKQETLLSFEYAGRIDNIMVDAGDTVTQGQVLATQDTELLSIKLLELQAQIQQVNAQITLNKTNVKRIKSLINEGHASEQRFDELTAEQAILAAQFDGLQANLASLRYQINKAKLIAPYSGVIGERYAAQGNVVAAGSSAFQLIKQSQQEVSVGVPLEIASTLELQQVLSVTIGEQQFNAAIIAIGQQLNMSNRTVNVRLALEQHHERFNGQIARVAINQVITEPGYWVPMSAVTDGIRGQWNIYLADNTDDNDVFVVKAMTVRILHADHDNAYISRIANEPINIIASGLHRYVPKELIRKAPLNTATGAQ